MKRIIPWVCTLSILLLVSCNLPSTGRSNVPASVSTATLSPAQIQTQISAMLTVMPSATAAAPGAPGDASPTVGLPTVSVDQASPTAEGGRSTTRLLRPRLPARPNHRRRCRPPRQLQRLPRRLPQPRLYRRGLPPRCSPATRARAWAHRLPLTQ